MLVSAPLQLIDVVEVEPLADYRISLLFEDGKRGIYDVSPLLDRGVFQALADLSVFNAAFIDCGTVTWPGEIDIAPEELYENCIVI